ncbi:MAG: 2-succinyl-5-enolpyruvyl-6-hydroxy-3-cyclohexene-1-carboxylic-acid synthase, partial [Gemmatimonadales bacterium]
MTDPNRNATWARALVEELVRCGVREVCLAPGSRSTPLVLAVAQAPELTVRVFLDERSAAFFALGIGKSTGAPAAVVTTSGTAVANLLPAVVEAHQAEAPLLLLTADRPHHLRDADANQAIRQPGIFGDYPRAAWDLPQPAVDDQALRHLRAVAARAVAASRGDPAGPVHLNLPFRKPLEPTPVEGDVPEDFERHHPVAMRGREGVPMVQVGWRRARASEEDGEVLELGLAASERPLLVVGPVPRPQAIGKAAIRFAAARGIPLLVDPLSGSRTLPDRGASRISAYDLFLRSDRVAGALRPDLVIRVGAAPTSAALNRWLESLLDVPQIVVDAGARWKDHLHAASHYLQVDPEEFLRERSLGHERTVPARWRALWEAVDGAARDGAIHAPGPRHEGHVAAAVFRGTPEECALFVSSSMPIRDVDGFGGVREDGLPVFGNRGASGIDGIVSTAAGVAAGTGRRTVALLGDLAFLHDANGLLALREPGVQLTLVVVNNDGGGIFHMLPVRSYDPPFERLFATPHGLDLGHLARLHEIPHHRVEDL